MISERLDELNQQIRRLQDELSVPRMWVNHKDVIMYGIPDEVVGMRIEKFEVDATKETIKLIGDKTVTMTCIGECCSTSWFEHIEDHGAFPGTILSIDEDDSASDIEDIENHRCTKLYFLTIKTNKGRFTVDMRNESNGYYGGSFIWSIQ